MYELVLKLKSMILSIDLFCYNNIIAWIIIFSIIFLLSKINVVFRWIKCFLCNIFKSQKRIHSKSFSSKIYSSDSSNSSNISSCYRKIKPVKIKKSDEVLISSELSSPIIKNKNIKCYKKDSKNNKKDSKHNKKDSKHNKKDSKHVKNLKCIKKNKCLNKKYKYMKKKFDKLNCQLNKINILNN